MNNLTTEEILWQSIKDIENGEAKTIKEDPINGFLISSKKVLSKKNVCDQSAKYNNGKPISRPTLDSYKEIAIYISSKKESNSPDKIKQENKKLKEKLDMYKKVIEQLKEDKNNLANENYQLNEENKCFKNKTCKSLK